MTLRTRPLFVSFRGGAQGIALSQRTVPTFDKQPQGIGIGNILLVEQQMSDSRLVLGNFLIYSSILRDHCGLPILQMGERSLRDKRSGLTDPLSECG